MPNKKTRDVASKSLFPSAQALVDTSIDIEQGDLLILSSNLITKPALETDGEFMLGCSLVSTVKGKLKKPYVTDVDASSAVSEVPGPEYGSVWKLVLKTGDALNPGDEVYLDPTSGTRHVQAAGTKSIGIYQGPAIASAVAGQEIEVLIGCRVPGDVLRF